MTDKFLEAFYVRGSSETSSLSSGGAIMSLIFFVMLLVAFSSASFIPDFNLTIALFLPVSCSRSYELQIQRARDAETQARSLILRHNNTLKVNVYDSCTASNTMSSLINVIASTETTGIVGPGSQLLFKTTVLMADLNNKPIVSWSSIQDMFDNEKKFDTLSRVVPVSRTLNLKLLYILTQFRWANVGFYFNTSFKWWTYVLEIKEVLRRAKFGIDHVQELQENTTHIKLVEIFKKIQPTTKGKFI